ncbi:hypothetical protein [Mangrovibrevibacter kandeliae]|uniref:hypothetical protein n=1 Tax=Mangrovibrevibacter kandeliae TaxID=2968473 RepID=UPI002117CBA8|nr:hypothetical protein [Aurantimonas sp. CSK15Z-1]MCQ8783660.1 hypothetical protein [Aurantimonas sp. CSK15Z-1]
MANSAITWEDLLKIYQNSVWVDDHIAKLSIVSGGIARTLKLLETSDRAYHEADIALQDDKAELAVGSVVGVRIGSPHRSLGLLVKDWDALLAPRSPEYESPRPSSSAPTKPTMPPSLPLRRFSDIGRP